MEPRFIDLVMDYAHEPELQTCHNSTRKFWGMLSRENKQDA